MRLNAVDLACRRGGREVFSGVSFRLERGEALAVTGRNGAGKSSLLRIVGGFIRPGGGRLWLDGGDAELTIAEQAPGQRRRLSIARLLAVKRPIWLLDEPASTLDTAGKARLAGFMQSHLAEGGLIVAATHGELEPSAAQELSLDQKNHSRATEALEPAEAAP
jgi:heme exporter protein A